MKKLIQKQAMGYTVFFSNLHELPKDLIMNIFSKYGYVRNIQEAGDVRGYRFVTYARLEDAMQAVKGLSQYRSIVLKEHKKKYRNLRNDSNNNNCTEYRKPYFRSRSRSVSHSIDVKRTSCADETDQTRSSIFPEKVRTLETSLASCEEAQVRSSSPFAKDQEKSSSFIEVIQITDSSSELSSTRDALEMDVDSVDLPSVCEVEESNDVITEVKDDNNNNDESLTTEIIKGTLDIIIGNLPDDFDERTILDLLFIYEPIGISPISQIPDTNTCYRRIHFKNYIDAQEAQQFLDRFYLSGKTLLTIHGTKDLRKLKQAFDNVKNILC